MSGRALGARGHQVRQRPRLVDRRLAGRQVQHVGGHGRRADAQDVLQEVVAQSVGLAEQALGDEQQAAGRRAVGRRHVLRQGPARGRRGLDVQGARSAVRPEQRRELAERLEQDTRVVRHPEPEGVGVPVAGAVDRVEDRLVVGAGRRRQLVHHEQQRALGLADDPGVAEVGVRVRLVLHRDPQRARGTGHHVLHEDRELLDLRARVEGHAHPAQVGIGQRVVRRERRQVRAVGQRVAVERVHRLGAVQIQREEAEVHRTPVPVHGIDGRGGVGRDLPVRVQQFALQVAQRVVVGLEVHRRREIAQGHELPHGIAQRAAVVAAHDQERRLGPPQVVRGEGHRRVRAHGRRGRLSGSVPRRGAVAPRLHRHVGLAHPAVDIGEAPAERAPVVARGIQRGLRIGRRHEEADGRRLVRHRRRVERLVGGAADQDGNRRGGQCRHQQAPTPAGGDDSGQAAHLMITSFPRCTAPVSRSVTT